jgi:hypothetical protein
MSDTEKIAYGEETEKEAGEYLKECDALLEEKVLVPSDEGWVIGRKRQVENHTLEVEEESEWERCGDGDSSDENEWGSDGGMKFKWRRSKYRRVRFVPGKPRNVIKRYREELRALKRCNVVTDWRKRREVERAANMVIALEITHSRKAAAEIATILTEEWVLQNPAPRS